MWPLTPSGQVLEILCQILQTDSLSAVQQWLLLAGQRGKRHKDGSTTVVHRFWTLKPLRDTSQTRTWRIDACRDISNWASPSFHYGRLNTGDVPSSAQCCGALRLQRKTWWWGWSKEPWVASTSRPAICKPLNRFGHQRGLMARLSTCHGETQRAGGRKKITFYFWRTIWGKCIYFYTRFLLHTEFPKKTNQVTLQCNRLHNEYCSASIGQKKTQSAESCVRLHPAPVSWSSLVC